MAGLNLVPNPTLIAIQTGVFMTTLYVVKKLFLDSYVELRQRRELATVGSQDAAVGILKNNESVQKQINEKISAALDKGRNLLNDSKASATAKRQSLVGSAETEARSILDGIEKEIKKDMETEQAKVPVVIKQLSDAFFAKLVR